MKQSKRRGRSKKKRSKDGARRSTRLTSRLSPRSQRRLRRAEQDPPPQPVRRRQRRVPVVQQPVQQPIIDDEEPPILQLRAPPPEVGVGIYCGNNRFHPRANQAGTRYSCFRRGFGVGYHVLEPDEMFNLQYAPMDGIRIYCGDQNLSQEELLQGGYQRFGNLPQCFHKGVGSGRRRRANETF